MKRIAASMRHHWLFFLIVPLLIIIMTWPTALYVFDSNTLWVPSDDLDLGMKLWDAWYSGRILSGEARFYFTDYLFFPHGLSLVFHNFSVPHVFLLLVANILLPATNAYNLCFMLIIFANVAACYVYIFYLFRDRRLGMFGSVVFGLSVFVIEHPVHPGLNIVATIPLVLYCTQRGLTERRNRWMVLAGGLSGFTAFIGMYIFICLVISVGIFLSFKLPKLWKARQFWVGILLLLAVAGSISALRVYPMTREYTALDEALNKGGGQEFGSDLLDIFVHRENVVTEHVFASVLRKPVPPVREDGYLGYVTLLLAAMGLLKSKPRNGTLIWFVLFLIFLVLKLGPALTIGGQTFDEILLPKYILNSMFPAVFRAFWITAYFHIGILLPLAILAVFGLRILLCAFPANYRGFVVIICFVLNLFETIEPPDSYIIPAQQLQYIDWLRSEDRQEAIALINVPFGRGPSKRYALLQVFNGYPHAEGLAARTPSAAYDYIRENSLLSAWRNDEGILCLPFNEGAFNHSLDQLLSDGFTHIVFHNDVIRHLQFANYSVMSVAPAYEDEYARVYRLRDLRGLCRENTFFSPRVLPQLASIMLPSKQPGSNEAASASLAAGMPPVVLPLAADGIVLGAPISLTADFNTSQLPLDEGIVLLVYYPPHTAAELVETSASRLTNSFKSCGRVGSTGTAYIEYFTRAEIPCALLLPDAALTVNYDNGVRLANALLESDGDQLDIATWWNRLPDEAHGVSIQVFDAAGVKAASGDFVIHHEPLLSHRLDLSPLDPGEYRVKLILYNYQGGGSIAGTVGGSQLRFDRELDIGSITLG